MSAETALARGRAMIEGLMVDTCTIVRLTDGILNQQTGERPPVSTTVYAGKCRTQQHTPGGATLTDEGEASRSMLRRELQLPIAGTEDIRVGDQATITAAPNDADLVGRVFRVAELAGKSHATARRLGVVEVT